MEWVIHSKKSVVFVKIDFTKVYDHIEWPFILVMLHALGLGLLSFNLCICYLGMLMPRSLLMGANLMFLVYLDPYAKVVLWALLLFMFLLPKVLAICWLLLSQSIM